VYTNQWVTEIVKLITYQLKYKKCSKIKHFWWPIQRIPSRCMSPIQYPTFSVSTSFPTFDPSANLLSPSVFSQTVTSPSVFSLSNVRHQILVQRYATVNAELDLRSKNILNKKRLDLAWNFYLRNFFSMPIPIPRSKDLKVGSLANRFNLIYGNIFTL
jgi:hypothetical protein